MRAPQFKATFANGIEHARYEWAIEASAHAPVLLCHATSFHARCWDAVVRRLDPASLSVTALDMRAHGRSGRVAPPMHWREFGEDVATLARELGWRGMVGVGHSMGGHAMALAASLVPGAFRALLLLDPVIFPAEAYGVQWVEEHYARKRRRQWDSSAQMFERFEARPPFDAWDREVLRDYCDYAIDETGTLACLPEVEGSIYERCTLEEANIHPDISRIPDIPVVVVRSRVSYFPGSNTMEASMTDPSLARRFRQGRDEQWNQSHFIPMEAPERVAALIAELAQ